jgi:hypothetical protein
MSGSCCRTSLLGVLNNTNFQRHIDPKARWISETSGRFKKACPEPFEGFVQSCPESCRREGRKFLWCPEGHNFCFARRAYFQYVSTGKWQERRGFFQPPPSWFRVVWISLSTGGDDEEGRRSEGKRRKLSCRPLSFVRIPQK